MKSALVLALIFAASLVTNASAAEITITINAATDKGPGKVIGTVTASDTKYGLLLVPKLEGLTPGAHGFHVHQHATCAHKHVAGKNVPAKSAGGHYDPNGTGKHLGPYGEGHLGDLPALFVGADGKANIPLLAPRLKVKDLSGRSIMIHAGGDNYSDIPKKLGGGGARKACGVVK